jgi:hypothetical protein
MVEGSIPSRITILPSPVCYLLQRLSLARTCPHQAGMASVDELGRTK